MKQIGMEQESNGICWGPKYKYETKVERYARFLELFHNFRNYNDMNEEEREELAAKYRKCTIEHQQQIKQKHPNAHVIPWCSFCGDAPCERLQLCMR